MRKEIRQDGALHCLKASKALCALDFSFIVGWAETSDLDDVAELVLRRLNFVLLA